jgi:transcriptional regulator with XRE-family HTH domain
MRQKKEINSTLREIEDIFVDEMIKKRKVLKITQKDLAKITQLTQRTISAIENKQISIRFGYVILFSVALDLDLSSIVDKIIKNISNEYNVLTTEDKKLIIKMYENEIPVNKIADILNKNITAIEEFLEEIKIEN